MTSSLKRTLRNLGFVLTAAAAFAALPSASFAYTAEQAQMCTGDAFRLCSSDIPDIPKITACMIKHRSGLSAGCRCRALTDRDMAQNCSKLAGQ
jgi:hypothetical protein